MKKVGFLQGFLEIVAIHQKDPRLFAGQFRYHVDGYDITGVGDADRQLAILNQRQGNETAFFRNVLGHQVQRLGVGLHLAQVDEIEVKLFRYGAGKFTGRDKSEPDQQVTQDGAGYLLLLQGDL